MRSLFFASAMAVAVLAILPTGAWSKVYPKNGSTISLSANSSGAIVLPLKADGLSITKYNNTVSDPNVIAPSSFIAYANSTDVYLEPFAVGPGTCTGTIVLQYGKATAEEVGTAFETYVYHFKVGSESRLSTSATAATVAGDVLRTA